MKLISNLVLDKILETKLQIDKEISKVNNVWVFSRFNIFKVSLKLV